MDLLKRSDEVKKEADKILSESKLLEILSQYGDVRVTGSYPLNTMLRPDLDVYAVTEKNDSEKMFQVMEKIIRGNYFEEVVLVNHEDFHKGDGWKGFYIQPKVTLGDRRWKLDVWLMEERDFRPYTQEFLELIKDEPDSQKRLAILELKEKMSEGSKYVEGVDGKLIYEAVLKHGVRTEEEFRRFVEEK
jgi:hypothetical protein